MITPSSWIESAISEHGLRVHILSNNDASSHLDELRRLFGDTGKDGLLWEALKDRTSRRRFAGWQDIERFIGNQKCFLLVEDGPNAYECIDGMALTQLLEECPGFEFYVTDSEKSYLLCYNHHDYLIGCGTAIEWVNSLADEA